jgi:hypothetical protein
VGFHKEVDIPNQVDLFQVVVLTEVVENFERLHIKLFNFRRLFKKATFFDKGSKMHLKGKVASDNVVLQHVQDVGPMTKVG